MKEFLFDIIGSAITALMFIILFANIQISRKTKHTWYFIAGTIAVCLIIMAGI